MKQVPEKDAPCCAPSCCQTGGDSAVKKEPSPGLFKIGADWTRADHLGQIKCRIGSSRMGYTVAPGLYALGEPDKDSDVLVSANYKLSFDILRRSLKGLNAWILVLDTKGINVWCAAGKGTFGTEELVNRITATGLKDRVGHRRLIVPQLGAVGVAAHTVTKKTGMKVLFGPVEAKDIPAYIKAGYGAAPDMRRVKFALADRLVLTPMELIPALAYFPLYALVVFLIFGLQASGIVFRDAWQGGWPFLALGLITIGAGGLATPAVLPAIPFRSFAVKGWIMGLLLVLASSGFTGIFEMDAPLLAAALVLFPALSSYIALQFTGSTTFTGMSGVKKELKFAIPFYAVAGFISFVAVAFFKLREAGLL